MRKPAPILGSTSLLYRTTEVVWTGLYSRLQNDRHAVRNNCRPVMYIHTPPLLKVCRIVSKFSRPLPSVPKFQRVDLWTLLEFRSLRKTFRLENGFMTFPRRSGERQLLTADGALFRFTHFFGWVRKPAPLIFQS